MKRYILPFALLALSLCAADAPVVFWTSDPTLPGQTVLVAGGIFGADSAVELARLGDGDAGDPPANPKLELNNATPAKIFQASEQSLKFEIAADQKPGVFAYRVRNGNSVSKTYRLNAPDVWWMQGDAGETATPSGSVRVFGRCLSHSGKARVKIGSLVIDASSADDYSLLVALPPDSAIGTQDVFVHNGFGGPLGWSSAGKIEVKAARAVPATIFNVMDFYGPNKEKEIARTLKRNSKPVDRTEAIQDALKKAKENGGGTVFFPAGSYGIQTELKVPPNTVLKGEGMGTVVLRWGAGDFALDGGGSQKRDEGPLANEYTARMISGDRFAISDMSIYVPLGCNNAMQVGDDFTMQRVRVRVDRYWMRSGQRQDGTLLRVGKNFLIADCDILAKASAIAGNGCGVVQRTKIQAGKCNVELGHANRVIIEDNQFISLDPTAYINIYEEGRNVYYARNKHESMYTHQSDFSFTFDGTGGAYVGGVTATQGNTVTLANDPTYVKWANESSPLWKKSALCILQGRGAGQYRFITANKGREWSVDQAFDIAPDASSVVTIVPFRGRSLVIGNRFEDANWVNMGYGSSLDIVSSKNTLVRCGQMLNYGLRHEHGFQPSWRVQYLDNDLLEGHTLAETHSPLKKDMAYDGTITRWAVHRGTKFKGDNSGNIRIGGNVLDVVVEQCELEHSLNFIEVTKEANGTLLRKNVFKDGNARYRGTAVEEKN